LGITYIVGRVKGPMGEEEVRFLVDTAQPILCFLKARAQRNNV